MKHLNTCIDRLFANGTLQNMALRIGKGDQILYEVFRSADGTIDQDTLFDMASVTKIVVTTSLCLVAMEKGLIAAGDTLSRFWNCPPDKQNITVGQLMTHCSGIGGHQDLTQPGNSYENIDDYILNLPLTYPTGTEVDYSCPGFILLGKLLEKVMGDRLDRLFQTYVAAPLEMTCSGFLPDQSHPTVNSNKTEELRGVVNDYNCQFLGGVAGNAGLFSNIRDLTRYVGFLQRKGAPLVGEQTFLPYINNYTAHCAQDRGLGFLYVTPRYAQTGGLFPTGSFGHCGHTGQSVFLDPQSGLYVVLLTDATLTVNQKYGKSNYNEVKTMRGDLHRAIKEDLSTNGDQTTD